MTSPGHVFVVRGRLENLDHDAVVLPSDRSFTVEPVWDPLLTADCAATSSSASVLRPATWGEQRWGRVRPGEGEAAHPAVWFVDVVAERGGEQLSEQARGMLARVEAALADIAAADVVPGSGRPRPLVALPALGVGGGGFGDVRGQVVRGLLGTCERVAAEHGVDIAVVALRASDYAAFQHARRESETHVIPLDEDRLALARDLAARAREGSLALFVGAGVSMGAGLPSWDGLVREVRRGTGADDDEDLTRIPILDQAELLARRLEGRLGEAVADITRRVTRYALGHAFLAALGCREAVTTNYDDLYERAAHDAGEQVVPVIPFEDVHPSAPWLLKMHGDVAHPERIVLTRSDFVGFDASSRPMGSVLQALLLTRHLLVVGASMTDDNFLRLAHEVLAFRTTHRGAEPQPLLGTVVTLRPDPLKAELWRDRFHYVAAADADAPDGEPARRLAIFLDTVAMFAAPASHLADPRYEYLLSDDDRAIAHHARELAQHLGPEPDGRWDVLRDALRRTGAAPGP